MKTIAPVALKALLASERSFGLLDLREHGQYGEGHLLFASNCPYCELELRAPRLLPDRDALVVVYDDGDGVGERGAARLEALGYRNLAILEGGAPAWAAAGYTLFKGVNVPSKVMGELLELSEHTPQIDAARLHGMRERGEPFLLVDGRPTADYRKMTIPGAVSIPNGELLYRLEALKLPSDLPLVIHCAGRTRGLVGAQSLINAGIPNPVFALENGTQGWALSGYALARGADPAPLPQPSETMIEGGATRARNLVARFSLPVVDTSELEVWRKAGCYLLDVRSAAEFRAGHIEGSIHAPAVQIVQATDEWIAMRRAKVVLIDDNGVRAASVAIWLGRMGHDAAILRGGEALMRPPKPEQPLPAKLPPAISPTALAAKTDAVLILDLRPGMEFRAGHIPGAIWAIRPRISRVIDAVRDRPIVLVAEAPGKLALFHAELREHLPDAECFRLECSMADWQDSGYPVEVTPEDPPDRELIDFLFFVHDRHNGNMEASRRYLAWETGLVAALDQDERAVFNF